RVPSSTLDGHESWKARERLGKTTSRFARWGTARPSQCVLSSERTPTMAFAIQRDILDAALIGDPTALDTVLKTIKPHVERQLLRYPVSAEDRRDLLQATLMQIVRRLGSFRAEARFSTWLFRVTANEALMLLRSRRRHRARFVEGLE